MRYWAIVRSSQRFIRIEMHGSIFYVLYIDDGKPYPSVSGPYRRHDKRFRVLPYGWNP